MFIKATICDRCDQPIMNDRHTATVSWKGGIEDSTYHDGCFNAMIEADMKYNGTPRIKDQTTATGVHWCQEHEDFGRHLIEYRYYPHVNEMIRTTTCKECGFIDDSTECEIAQ